MSSRSYRPPPGQGDPPRSVSSISRAPAYEGESDLFGHRPSVVPAAPAPARAASAPPPSMPAPSQGPERLAGRRPGGHGGESPPAPCFSKGARDENSVLFSVKDIVSAAALRQSTAPPPTSSSAHNLFGNDPTGIVDLYAMAQTTQSSLEVKPLDIAHLRPSVVPMAAQHVGSMWPSQEQPPTRWEQFIGLAKGPRAPLFFAGLGVVALLFVGFGAMLTAWAMSDSGADLSASIAAPARGDEGPELIEREIVQRTKVADAPTDASEGVPASHARAGRKSSGRASFGKSSAKSSSSKSGSKASAPKKKASDPCNCHGVLACAMRCTK